VVIEHDCELGKGSSLKNCILLPGSKAGVNHESSLHENCIIGPGFKVDLNESEILLCKNDGSYLIGTGGSERRYYRIRRDDKSFVLMHCNNDDPDFERHIELSRYFLKHAIPVPALIKVQHESRKAEFEDAGDLSLYSYLKCPREEGEVESVYKKVIDAMIQIHVVAAEHISECPLLQERVFDYEHFRWETDYFIERYVKDVNNLRVEHVPALEKELHRLALRADSIPKTVMHRDFQSQNIMIMKAQEIRIIDFQGARIGPPAYDIASILRDPYYRLHNSVRERLLEYYIKQMSVRAGENFDVHKFRESILPCRLQRHMQALGAYGFLSSVKGKKYFLKFVPEALRLLKEDIRSEEYQYPALYKLVISL
jgi:aminoglycoside/choline kinase family phosphotransferase